MWLKRIAAPKWWPITRKTHKFITTVRGPHAEALPLQILVRDVLGLADNSREARNIINAGNVLVDGKIRKDTKFGVGVMDVIEIPTLKKSWRVTPKNGFTLVETSGNDSKLKICRIANKKILRGGKVQLNLNDGKNILSKDKHTTRDSIVIEIPSHKIIETIKFEKGNLALIISGKNQGTTAKIKDIDHANKRVWLEHESEKFESPISNIVMVGKDKPLVKIE